MEFKDWDSPTHPTPNLEHLIEKTREWVRDRQAITWYEWQERLRSLRLETPYFQGELLRQATQKGGE